MDAVWILDVYEVAPAPVTAFIASVSKRATFAWRVERALTSDYRTLPKSIRKQRATAGQPGRAEHRTDVQICIQTIMGKIRLHLPARTVVLAVGQLLLLGSDAPHDVEAIEESVFLLTVGFPHVTPSESFVVAEVVLTIDGKQIRLLRGHC